MRPDHPIIPFNKAVNTRRIGIVIDKGLELARRYYDTEPVGPDFDGFVETLSAAFPKVNIHTLYQSLIHLAGRRITRELVKDVTWRLAGNIQKLKSGSPVFAWTSQTDLEWVPIIFLEAKAGRSDSGRFGFYYAYRIQAGSPAGQKFVTFLSNKYVRFMAKTTGFNKTRKYTYSFTNGIELVRMRLYVLLDPQLSRNDAPGFFHFHVPTSVKKYNQHILTKRVRGIPCPLGYTREEMPCYQCPIGYDQCSAGCHPSTFYAKGCPRCNQESWFDPSNISPICINCSSEFRVENVQQD